MNKFLVKGNFSENNNEIHARRPIIHWIDPNSTDPVDPWEDLVWGSDSAQDFADALIDYFDNLNTADPRQGDLIGGIDKDDVLVVLRISIPVEDSSNKFEQKEVPSLTRNT